MKKLIKKLLLTLAVLTLLLVLPISAHAQKASPLDAYVDTDMLYDYLDGWLQQNRVNIDLEEFGIPASMAYEVENFILFSFPDTLLSSSFTVYTNNGLVTAARIYMPSTTSAKIKAIKSAATDLLVGLEDNDDLSDVMKALIVHDRLALWTEYDFDSLKLENPPHDIYTTYGALVNRLSVCDGYAHAYQYLLARVGVRSDVHSSVILNHAWNGVHINGEIFHVDVTHDDRGGRSQQGYNLPVDHTHFLSTNDRYKVIDGDCNFNQPYASTYSRIYWPEFTFYANSTVYAKSDLQLYTFDGVNITKVEIPNVEYMFCNETDIPVGNKLVQAGFDYLMTLDLTTGEHPTVWSAGGRIADLSYHDGKIACLVNDMWVYPFADKTYTVTFQDHNGKVLQNQTYQYGQKVNAPADPTRAGYHFTGWDKDVVVCAGNTVYTATYAPYSRSNGWIKKGSDWYYIHNDRYKTGWLQDGKNWYYLNYGGKMETGLYCEQTWLSEFQFKKTYYYFNTSGAMETGWKKLDGSWYYFKPGYGNAATLWSQIDGRWYFFNNQGQMHIGWLNHNGKEYYLSESVGMITGWKKIGDAWYYFDSTGDQVEGWLKDGGRWYYFNNYGQMQTGWINVGNTRYYMTSGGAMANGWQKIDSTYYYFNSNGIYLTGWQKISGNWYYFKTTGEMTCSVTIPIGGKYYAFDENGAMRTGFVKLADKTYYFGADGVRVTGWQKINGNWYYFWTDGFMITGSYKIGDNLYHFDTNGIMKTGWIKIPGAIQKLDGTKADAWRYANSSGVVQTGWKQIGGDWYYFNSSSGYMATGRNNIDNKWYTFGEDGKLIK